MNIPSVHNASVVELTFDGLFTEYRVGPGASFLHSRGTTLKTIGSGKSHRSCHGYCKIQRNKLYFQ